MDWFVPEIHFETIIQDKKFNDCFKDFFKVKLKRFRKRVNRLYYNCVTECIYDEYIDFECSHKCEMVFNDAYLHVINLLKRKQALYPRCIEMCHEKDEMINCIEFCSDKIIKIINEINVKAEFELFLKNNSEENENETEATKEKEKENNKTN